MKDGYELLMTVRTKKGNRVEFVVKETGNKIFYLSFMSGEIFIDGQTHFFCVPLIDQRILIGY